MTHLESPPQDVCKSTSMERRKQTPHDFQFGKVIGEGSFSSVFLSREVASGKEFAIKMCEKQLILKEKKTEYIKSEKDILVKITQEWEEKRPFFVRLHSTFHDTSRLYFVITYAKNGDLLRFIDAMASKDIDCTQFYASELVSALEFLHERRIIHRDLKPENILLTERMHIMITDFGSAKILPPPDGNGDSVFCPDEPAPKRCSFVGTAQYVSPEVLSGGLTSYASDLWAFGCVLYQMVTGMAPFQSQSEYLIFQKIQKLEYTFYDGFDDHAKDLIQSLLVIEPANRLGAKDETRYESMRSHAFFEGVNFDTLSEATPPAISEFIPKENKPDACWGKEPNMPTGPERIERLLIDDILPEDIDNVLKRELMSPPSTAPISPSGQKKRRNIANLSHSQREEALEDQIKSNKFNKFVEGHLILKQGVLDKKKGLWSRRRMFLLTEGPALYYVDPDNMVLKGRIPWDKTIRAEVRDFKMFFVHTPNRSYYLIDPESTAKDWCHAIDEVSQYYYGEES